MTMTTLEAEAWAGLERLAGDVPALRAVLRGRKRNTVEERATVAAQAAHMVAAALKTLQAQLRRQEEDNKLLRQRIKQLKGA